MNNNFGNLDNLSSKEIKLFLKNLDNNRFELFKDLLLPVYKINAYSCFLTKEGSNATITFKHLIEAFTHSIKRGDITSIKRLAGVEGRSSYSNYEHIPKYYYNAYTFTYKEVKVCLIKILFFTLEQYNRDNDTLLSLSDIPINSI